MPWSTYQSSQNGRNSIPYVGCSVQASGQRIQDKTWFPTTLQAEFLMIESYDMNLIPMFTWNESNPDVYMVKCIFLGSISIFPHEYHPSAIHEISPPAGTSGRGGPQPAGKTTRRNLDIPLINYHYNGIAPMGFLGCISTIRDGFESWVIPVGIYWKVWTLGIQELDGK